MASRPRTADVSTPYSQTINIARIEAAYENRPRDGAYPVSSLPSLQELIHTERIEGLYSWFPATGAEPPARLHELLRARSCETGDVGDRGVRSAQLVDGQGRERADLAGMLGRVLTSGLLLGRTGVAIQWIADRLYGRDGLVGTISARLVAEAHDRPSRRGPGRAGSGRQGALCNHGYCVYRSRAADVMTSAGRLPVLHVELTTVVTPSAERVPVHFGSSSVCSMLPTCA